MATNLGAPQPVLTDCGTVRLTSPLYHPSRPPPPPSPSLNTSSIPTTHSQFLQPIVRPFNSILIKCYSSSLLVLQNIKNRIPQMALWNGYCSAAALECLSWIFLPSDCDNDALPHSQLRTFGLSDVGKRGWKKNEDILWSKINHVSDFVLKLN